MATNTSPGITAADEPVPVERERDDRELIVEAGAGSHEAFRHLVERHMKRVYNLAYGFVRDHDTAEDIAQEAFVRAYAALPSFRGEAEFGTWIHRITVNLALNRKRQTRSIPFTELGEVRVAGIASSGDQGKLEQRENQMHIERALHELPTMQRAVVILRHVNGLSTKQVGSILRCSEGSVKTHLFRGLGKMRRKLAFLQEEGA